jgi:hypothetical protein
MKALILKSVLHKASTKFFLSLLDYKPCDGESTGKPNLYEAVKRFREIIDI